MNSGKIVEHLDKQVLLRTIKGQEYLGIVHDVNQEHTVIAERTGKKTSEKVFVTLKNKEITSIASKSLISFVHPKFVVCHSYTRLQTSITHEIERVKKEKTYQLQTRRFKSQQNGTNKRTKWSVAEFEREVAKWLKAEKNISLCPFALVKTSKKPRFLLCIDNQGNLVKINNKGKKIID